MSYSNQSRTFDFDSLQPEQAAAAAVRAIKDLGYYIEGTHWASGHNPSSFLNENPAPRRTELLRNFVRDAHKHLQEERTSTSDEYQSPTGAKLVVLSKEIRKGNDGTVIYEGRYGDRPVAVKRVPRSHYTLVDREIEHLIKADRYHNVVRYHEMVSDRHFYYLAVERCDCNLDDLIQMYSAALVDNKSQSRTVCEEDSLEKLKRNLGNVKLWEGDKARPSPLLLKLMRDVVSGLVVLHALNIIHRDLKPKSILIIKEISTLCAKLSDMGFCRSLSGNKSYLTNHNTGCVATGWKPREQLLCGQQTRAMDMFSFGCILFFCITQGKHPFGEPDERDTNIKNNNKNLLLIQDFPEALHLISCLLEADDPKKRPDANEVLQHPLFWNAKKRLSFLRDTSDRAEDINSELSIALNGTAGTVLAQCSKGKYWNKKVDGKIMCHMLIHRTRYPSTVQGLLRMIRNMFNHYEELPTDIQELVGSRNEGLDGFFTSKFPMLLIKVHEVVGKGYKEEECFKEYFKENL